MSKPDDNSLETGCLVYWSIILFVVSFTLGLVCTREYYRREAIKADVAEWVIDPVTGEKSFHYKTPEP